MALRPLLLAGALLLLFPVVQAEDPSDWTVAHDTTLDGGTKAVPGKVVVQEGATLTLRGATLLVGDQVRVEPGGRLVLGPNAGVPTRLAPYGTAGFSMHVAGRIESAGTPRTIVEGLNGGALEAATAQAPGGITIAGTADLRDLWVRNGTAGLVVLAEGQLDLRDSRLESLYLMGVASLGAARLQHVETAGNIIALSGKGPACSIAVADSELDTVSAVAQMNGCPLTIERSRLLHGGTDLVLTNPATYTVRDSILEGYKTRGIRGDGSNTLLLSNVTFLPSAAAQHALELRAGTRAVLEGVTIGGHAGAGILAQASTLEFRGVAIAGNAGFGVESVNGDFPAGLGGARLDGNAAGPIRDLMHVRLAASMEDGTPLAGYRVAVTDRHGAPVAEVAAAGLDGATLEFPTFANATDGMPEPLGPFRYLVTSEAGTAEGTLVPTNGVVAVTVVAAPARGPGATVPVPAVAALLGVFAAAVTAARRRAAA